MTDTAPSWLPTFLGIGFLLLALTGWAISALAREDDSE